MLFFVLEVAVLFTRPFLGQSRSVATRARQAAVTNAPKPLESLESRTLMSVSLGSDGWTDITKSGDSKVIYVSSSGGSDSNSGLTADSPLKTINKGASLVRSGMPDHLLLKRGDSWTETLMWSKSGRSSQEPALIGTYGSGERPLIKAGSGTGIDIASGSVSNLAIVGIHFQAHTRIPGASNFVRSSGGYGIRFVAGTSSVLVEDVEVDHFKFNLLFQAYNSAQSNVKIRRSVITDSYGLSVASSGIFAQGVQGLTLEENVFDHNGWNTAVSGASSNSLSHNAYLSNENNSVVVKGNIFSDASSHGLQMRAGGEVRNNLFLRNPIGLSYGIVNGAALKAGGVTGTIDGNVFTESRDIGGSARGWAMELGNIKGATVRNNVMTNDTVGQAPAITLNTGSNIENSGSGVGINNLVIEDNIVNNWYGAFGMSGSLSIGGSGVNSLNNLTVRNNDFQNVDGPYNRIVAHTGPYSTSEESWSNNRYYDAADPAQWFFMGTSNTSLSTWKSKLEPTAQATKVTYSNPNASISSYAGSYATFVNGARDLSSNSWNSKYTAVSATNYIKSAFNQSGSTPTDPTPPPVVTPPPGGDTTNPTLVSYTTGASAITMKFSEDVKNSLTTSDLTVTNTSNGSAISSSSMKLVYDTTSNTATWTFPGLSNAKLPTGSFQAKLPDQNVTDNAGNRLGGGADIALNFNVTSTSSTTPGSIVLDTIQPAVVGYSGTSTSVKIKFSENVSASLAAKDLVVKNTSNGNGVYDSLRLSYNTSTNEATWTWPTLSGTGRLGAGNWQITLPDETVTDLAGNRLAGGKDFTFSFSV